MNTKNDEIEKLAALADDYSRCDPRGKFSLDEYRRIASGIRSLVDERDALRKETLKQAAQECECLIDARFPADNKFLAEAAKAIRALKDASSA